MRADPSTDALIGMVIGGRYRLVHRVGKGGMGVVYEADHLALGKRVAVKLLLEKYTDDEEVVARFQREARTASAIGDEHIVEVTDAGTTEDGRPWLVMELLLGQSLAAVAEATGPMPAARAIPIVRQVLRGLGAAHAKGIVHRDMKPENVFLVQKPERPDFVKIMDFGISKFMALTESKVRLTATGAVIGTPVYMAPEQFLGQPIDHRVDLYAAGVLLYLLLTGRPVFSGSTETLMYRVVHDRPAPPSSIAGSSRPAFYDALVAKALAKDPAQRFASAAAFKAALLSAAGRPADPAAEETVYAPLQANPAAQGTAPSTQPSLGGNGTWDPATLARVELLLTRSVGPLASVLVRRAARECTELPALRTRLAEQIGDAAARQAFLAGTAADPLATRTPATPVTQSGTQILAPAAPLDPTLIDKATQLLALRIGPIAKVVARKAAQTSGRDAFFAALAEAVDDAGARSKLLAELSRLR